MSLLTAKLPKEEISNILDEAKSQTAVSAMFSKQKRVLSLIMADDTIAIIPLLVLEQEQIIISDFNKIELVNHGQTVKLGEYEVAVDYILEHKDIKRMA